MLRTYLEWLAELPWKDEPRTGDRHRRGAPESSTRTTTAWTRSSAASSSTSRCASSTPTGKSPILCFVGPPGVGKTSLGQSIARATGRKFQRIALGGVHDEAEIRGHRRTYIGALPGNVIQAIRRAESRNGGADVRRDRQARPGRLPRRPVVARCSRCSTRSRTRRSATTTSACDFDLSKVMFIATANVLDTIPGPLRDRMEIIQLPGYTEEEKLEIAKRYLVKRQLEANGLKAEQVELHGRRAARDHRRLHARGRRAQPRARDRRGAALRRDADRRRHARKRSSSTQTICTPSSARKRFENEVARCAPRSRAWRPASPGRRSAATSCSSRRSQGAGHRQADPHRPAGRRDEGVGAGGADAGAQALHSASPLEKTDIHVHVPAGATPKDGPSAGVAMFLAPGLAAHRHAGALRRRDDRRDLAARPGAADRRREGEDARRATRRHQDRDAAQAQREGPRGRAGRGAGRSSSSCSSSASRTRCGPRSASCRGPSGRRRRASASRLAACFASASPAKRARGAGQHLSSAPLRFALEVSDFLSTRTTAATVVDPLAAGRSKTGSCGSFWRGGSGHHGLAADRF